MNEAPFVIYRLRFALKPKQAIRIPPNQYGMFYAMLCEAHARVTHGEAALPDGVLITPPDQAVRWVNPSGSLGLGMTLLAPNEHIGIKRAIEVVDGLRALGKEQGKSQWLRQFQVDTIYDCVTQSKVQTAGMLKPILSDHFRDEWSRIASLDALTLEFKTPLRCALPKNKRTDGHGFFDDTYFSATSFLNRLAKRLEQLGWNMDQAEIGTSRTLARDNQLVWLDIGYGSSKDRKTLGGCMGRITFQHLTDFQKACLVMGQYSRAGENTRFGFGEYRIVELGDDPFAIHRTHSLIEHAIRSTDADRVAEEMALESGVLSQALSRVQEGSYQCGRHFRVAIAKPSGGERILAIPTPLDRAVQRVMLPVLTEGIDGFLKSSSMAFRRGLGRTQAAQQIKRAYRDGYVWAVKADFVAFFDNVSHSLLRKRLSAYLADTTTVDWIMKCVESGSPDQGRGLPTGSPLSPVLANLFLDHFDEQLRSTGGRLIRYADDFLILCKSQEEANQLFQAARKEANQLQLELNADKSKTVEFRSGFVFLGFHFQWKGEWISTTGGEPQLIDDVAWTPTKKPNAVREDEIVLPGESDWNTPFRQSTVIVGDDYSHLRSEANAIVFESESDKPAVRISHDKIQELWIGSKTSVHWSAIRSVTKSGGAIFVVEDSGRVETVISNDETTPNAALVQRQCQLLESPERRLTIATKLIHAKIQNYGILSDFVLENGNGIGQRLRELSARALECETAASFLGVEGSAAAMWYGRFSESLGKDYSFQRRTAPDAHDPINVMLNLGQTILHRWCINWIQRAGLVETIGVMHEPRAGHAALASDLQEPFRHLVDRTVIEASRSIRASEFSADPEGPFPLRMSHHARTAFIGSLHRNMDRSVAGLSQSEPRSYREQMRLLVFRYAEWLSSPEADLKVFLHPRGYSRANRIQVGKRI